MTRNRPCWRCSGKREISVLALQPADCISDDLSHSHVIRSCPECGDPTQPERPMPREDFERGQREFWNSLRGESNL